MDGNTYHQHPYHGLPHHDFASRSMSMTDRTSQQPLDAMAAMNYQNSMTMWHHQSPQQSNPAAAAMSMMPHAHSQPHNTAALSMMLQNPGLRHYYNPVKMFPPSLQQAQNPQFYHASMACSKRFSEEEKQKLEKVFTDETQKPSTTRKRQLAEELGCPIPKVNNWFQNRRAREKQLHRVQAYEASQAADLAAAENDEADDQDDEDNAASGQPDSTTHRTPALKPSSALFSDADDSSEHEESLQDPSKPCDLSPSNSSAHSPNSHGNNLYSNDTSEQALQIGQQAMISMETSQVDMSADSTVFHVHQGVMSSSPENYTGSDSENGTALDMFHEQLASDFSSVSDYSGMHHMDSAIKHGDYFQSSTSFMSQSTPAISQEVLVHEPTQDVSSRQQNDTSDFTGFDSLSPDMLSDASPMMDQMDSSHNQSSTNASIASRRKIRPPQRLNQTALRNYPNGPKTGIESSKQSELYRTMRRAASATGPLHGKILKSGPPVSPLSPRTFEPAFLEHIARSSSLSTASSALKEPVTASPVVSSIEQRYLSADNFQRSSSLSVGNTYGEPLSLSPRTRHYSREDSLNGGQTPNFQQFQNPTFALDNGCGNISPNEPLTTPGLSQFGSELEFPTTLSAPRYVESEPATPSYVPVNLPAASTTQGQGFPTLKVETPPQGDSYPWSRSPDQLSMWNGALGQYGEPQSHTFQFQPNITPQNFNSPGQA